MQIDGYFNFLDEPVIKLDVGSSQIEFLVDTGFSGGLIIPEQLAKGLDIIYARELEEFSSVTGEPILMPLGSMMIIWFGQATRVPVSVSPKEKINEAILGGNMLKDCRLIIDYVKRTVTIMAS